MPGGYLPVLYPLLPNVGGTFDELVARALPVCDYHDNPGIKLPLGMIHIG